MSLLLSNYRKRRYKNGQGGHRSARTNTRTGVEKSEFDEYGTELHPDARVWKVYVEETDKFDAELVKIWNDSTDVILIFAALFSAISTAFLIESSKMLQPDPVDVSAQTLATISQTLLVLANGTQRSGSITPPANPSTDFAPSWTAVCVNLLWFLSLSLSLATSFIAILSKDWCHAFMSGRTGHHYSQTCLRQQKWDMLERWKMSELLAVLPSIIHVALLLFSIGLCILLWDMHSVIAIPVICVSGLAFGFYVWSSATAIALDLFPYPTIVSKLCRTELAQLAYRYVVQCPRHVLWTIVYIGVQPFKYIFDCLYGLSVQLSRETWCGPRHPHMYRPAYFVWQRLKDTAWSSLTTEQWIEKWFPRPKWTLSLGTLEPKGPAQGNLGCAAPNNVKSLALSWLITSCEVPRSVDVALQSIAGAGQGFDSAPLLKCNPTLEILRRLASSNLYRDGNAETAVLLYSRALSFLGSSANKSEVEKNSGDSLEVLIWNMQTRIESNVAGLIVDSQFQPENQNLNALRIGNTAASRSLRFLKGDVEGANELFDSIRNLMEQHLSKDASLHPAALLSLVNATALLLLFYNDFAAARSIRTLCVKLAADAGHGSTSRLKVALIACAPKPRIWIGHENALQIHKNSSTARAIQSLIAFQSHDEKILQSILESGVNYLWNPTWVTHPDNNNSETAKPAASDESESQFLSGIHQLLLKGGDYNNTPSQLIDILHCLHPFPPTNSKLDKNSETKSKLLGLIWNLGEEFERRLASLISDGTVDLNQSNIDALRLGSDMALTSAKILRKQLEDGEIEYVISSLISLLGSHLNRTNVLHNPALLSVTYAAALLCLLSPTSINPRQTNSAPRPASWSAPDHPLEQSGKPAANRHAAGAPTLPSLCRQLARGRSSTKLVPILANASLLWCQIDTDHTLASLGGTGALPWKIEAVRGLAEICSEHKETWDLINDYIEQLPGPSSAPKHASNLEITLSQLNRDFLSETASTIPRESPSQLEEETTKELQEDVAPRLRALHAIYRLTATIVLYPDIYLSVVETTCHSPTSAPLFAYGVQMLSKWPFPTMSEKFTTALEQRGLVPLLEATSTSDNRTKRYFAQGHLWLLLSLFIYPGDTADGREKLKVQLDKCRRSNGDSEEDRHWDLGWQLFGEIKPDSILARELGVWAWRLEECLCQFRDDGMWDYVSKALRDVPPELRGLSSFTVWPRRADDPSTNEPQGVEEMVDVMGETASNADSTIEGEGVTCSNDDSPNAGLVMEATETGTGAEKNDRRVLFRQDLEASAQGSTDVGGKCAPEVNQQGEIGEVRGEQNDGVETVSDEQEVADAGAATEATDGPQSEDEEAEGENAVHGGGSGGYSVIDMGGSENEPNRPTSSS